MESTASLPLHSKAPPPHFTLYTFWLSSAVWRIRIALNYKQLTYTPQFVDLLKDEHHTEEYGRISPTHYVPTLVVSYAETQQQLVLGESLAIMEWLEETHPAPPLLPSEPSQSHTSAVRTHMRRRLSARRQRRRTSQRSVILSAAAVRCLLTRLRLLACVVQTLAPRCVSWLCSSWRARSRLSISSCVGTSSS